MVRLLQAWLWLREKGQGLVEYALILVLIAIVVIAILTVLGTRVSQVFSQIASALRGS
jgi:pilus assembly protein Flp/PilA